MFNFILIVLNLNYVTFKSKDKRKVKSIKRKVYGTTASLEILVLHTQTFKRRNTNKELQL